MRETSLEQWDISVKDSTILNTIKECAREILENSECALVKSK